MPLYIVLASWTRKGIETIKDAPARIDRARELAHSMGAELESFLLLMGQYDFGVRLRAPDDDTVAKFVLAVSSQGNIKTETMRAFTEEEFRQFIDELP